MKTPDRGLILKNKYSSLAYCRVMEQRWRALGYEKKAAHYGDRALVLKSQIKRLVKKKDYPLLVKYFVFYPNGEGWTKSEFWSSRPEVSGFISPGMQGMIDGLLKNDLPERRAVIIPRDTARQIVDALSL